MSKSPARHSIQPAGRPAAAEEPPAAPPGETPSPPQPAKPPAWNWQLVVFLWATSFVFLALYEFLWVFFRTLFK